MTRALFTAARSHAETVFRAESWAALEAECELTVSDDGQRMAGDAVARLAPEAQAIITGWGSVRLPRTVLESAPELSLIVHTAGTVRAVVDPESVREVLLPRGTRVFSANGALARNVAESTIGLLIMASRCWERHIALVREGGWRSDALRANAQYLLGATVGVLSASKVGVETIRLLRAFETRILLHDPCIGDDRCRELGAEPVGLDELFERSDMVTIHAPSLRATRHMVGERQLRLLRDGATLVNTARGSVIDEEALIRECKRREIYVALDVTDPEPPSVESELRSLPNVIVTPHLAGCGRFGYYQIGDSALAAIRDHFAGRPVAGAVDLERFDELA